MLSSESITIDCHTHCYPVDVYEDPAAWARLHRESHWGRLVISQSGKRPSLQGWASVEAMLAAMDAAAVSQAVLLGWYWENETTCRWHNTVIADWVGQAPDRFIGFASIYLGGGAAATLRQLEAAEVLGLRGVGELHPGVQCFDSGSAGWQALAEWCVTKGWPVNLHATEAAGLPHPGNVPTPLNDFVLMAKAWPELRIILAHWGGGLAFFEQNPRLRAILKNVYYDSAASPLLYEPAVLRRVVDCVGVHKLLFGSDYPLRLYPARQREPDFALFLDSIRSESGLTAGEFKSFLGANARNLLALVKGEP